MNRRELALALLSLAITPLRTYSQQPSKVWRIGFLSLGPRPASIDAGISGELQRGLRELGYAVGKNLVIEWRFADADLDRLAELAAELVRLKVDVIVASNPNATSAAQKASSTLPIVMGSVGDPVGLGLIKSLARPGGNVTGPTSLTADLGSKRLEILLAMAPKTSRVAILMHPSSPNHITVAESIQAAGQKRRVTIVRVEAGTREEIEAAFPAIVKEKAGALIVPLNPFFNQQRSLIAALSTKHRLPSIAADRIYPEAGCLMSYGSSLPDDFHRAATYIDKIFKGAKPADLPVEQPTSFALIINGKTAKTLGLTIPRDLLLQAEVIE